MTHHFQICKTKSDTLMTSFYMFTENAYESLNACD